MEAVNGCHQSFLLEGLYILLATGPILHSVPLAHTQADRSQSTGLQDTLVQYGQLDSRRQGRRTREVSER